LSLDSLEKQAADWKQKLENLDRQRLLLGPGAPVELTATINYVKRELDRIEYEIVDLRERVELPLNPEQEAASREVSPAPPSKVGPTPEAYRMARANTQEMPTFAPESEKAVEPEEDTS
jgi:hypothetical protein